MRGEPVFTWVHVNSATSTTWKLTCFSVTWNNYFIERIEKKTSGLTKMKSWHWRCNSVGLLRDLFEQLQRWQNSIATCNLWRPALLSLKQKTKSPSMHNCANSTASAPLSKKTPMSRREESEEAAPNKSVFWENGRITVQIFWEGDWLHSVQCSSTDASLCSTGKCVQQPQLLLGKSTPSG